MTWQFQKTRWGYHELRVWRQHDGWVYAVIWHSETAITTVGKGSQAYRESDDARHAAILHLESILPRPQAKRLLSNQSDLVWEPWFEPRKRRS